jgi:starch synthase
MKILFVSSEVFPFSKTGGLADVAGALPLALKELGADVRVISPLYRCVREGRTPLRHAMRDIWIPFGGPWFSFDLQEADAGFPALFIEREDLYERPNLYRSARGDYYDNFERFAFFCRAVIASCKSLAFKPDIIHCNDWQCGLIPALVRAFAGSDPFLEGVSTVFSIHNIGFQGLFDPSKLLLTGLPREQFFHPEGLEYWGNISLLKSGIVYSDAITTVSPTYAEEIQGPEHGRGMEGVLRRRSSSLKGILNGVDYAMWDPSKDPHIPAPFGPGDMKGKALCKASLLKEMGLDDSIAKRPLAAMVSRLDDNKGLDLLLGALERIVSDGTGLLVLGKGEARIEEGLEKASRLHKGLVAVRFALDEPLAHRIIAGSDMFLMPSRYEPCGLTQMYAMKYGTIPVVRLTGGLRDTVRHFDPSSLSGTGVTFGPYEVEAFVHAVERGKQIIGKAAWRDAARANCMAEDFSWRRSATAYMELYDRLLRK